MRRTVPVHWGKRGIAGEFIMAMGWVQLGLDELQQSRQLFERAFTEKCEARDGYGICCARHGLATVALKEGLLKEALEEFRGTLHSAIELQLKDTSRARFMAWPPSRRLTAKSSRRRGVFA